MSDGTEAATDASDGHFVALTALRVGDWVVCADGTAHEVHSTEAQVKIVLKGLGVFTFPADETVMVVAAQGASDV